MVSTRPMRTSMPLFCSYIVLLFISETTRVIFTPSLAQYLGDMIIFVEPLWKGVLWIGPMVLYILYVTRSNVVSSLKLTLPIRKGLIWGVLGSLLFCLPLLSAWLRKQPLSFTHSTDDWLNGVLLAGPIEEAIFRGFLFQQLQIFFTGPEWDRPLLPFPMKDEVVDLTGWMPSRSTFIASTLSTLLFVAIHFSLWLPEHRVLELMLTTSLLNLLLGYFLCLVLTRSQSLWACILIHVVHDLVVLLLT